MRKLRRALSLDKIKEKHLIFGVWFLIFILWAIYRANFTFSEWIDEFIVKPVIFVLPVIYIVLIREKKKLSDLGLGGKGLSFMTDLNIGVLIGIMFAFEGLFVNYIKYQRFEFSPLPAIYASGGVVGFLILNFATSVWEEILGRGFLYNRMYKLSKNQLWAAGASSFLFVLLHIPIMFTRLHLMGISFLIYPLSILILSITNSYIFTLRKSLILPILLHTFWNMTVALYL